MLATGEPIRSITLYAPVGGFVTERNAFPNQKVTPDSDLYTITDLSRVWIMADVFESDITSIKLGDAGLRHASRTAARRRSRAKVNYIQPQVDPTTRTLKVRLDAANPGLRLKPDMFVNVEFGVAGAARLTVPAEAVLDTGDRQTVFVDRGNGYLEPRAGGRRRAHRRPRRDHCAACRPASASCLRQVPDRFGKPAEGRGVAAWAAAGAHRHDRPHHRVLGARTASSCSCWSRPRSRPACGR